MTDKPDLPLSVIRSALVDAEAEVTQALQRFRERTGLVIVGAEIEPHVKRCTLDGCIEIIPVCRVRLQPQSI